MTHACLTLYLVMIFTANITKWWRKEMGVVAVASYLMPLFVFYIQKDEQYKNKMWEQNENFLKENEEAKNLIEISLKYKEIKSINEKRISVITWEIYQSIKHFSLPPFFTKKFYFCFFLFAPYNIELIHIFVIMLKTVKKW